MRHLLIALSLTAVNFIYQIATEQRWDRAVVFSAFQAVAVFGCWLTEGKAVDDESC